MVTKHKKTFTQKAGTMTELGTFGDTICGWVHELISTTISGYEDYMGETGGEYKILNGTGEYAFKIGKSVDTNNKRVDIVFTGFEAGTSEVSYYIYQSQVTLEGNWDVTIDYCTMDGKGLFITGFTQVGSATQDKTAGMLIDSSTTKQTLYAIGSYGWDSAFTIRTFMESYGSVSVNWGTASTNGLNHEVLMWPAQYGIYASSNVFYLATQSTEFPTIKLRENISIEKIGNFLVLGAVHSGLLAFRL